MVGVIVIVLKFALSVSCSIEVPSGVVVGLSTDALAGVMLGVLRGIDIADVSVNAFAVAITSLTFPLSTPLEEFSR